MIYERRDSIFVSDAEILVNPVNCVGAAGRGLAAEFKERFPRNFNMYQAGCRTGAMRPGEILMHMNSYFDNPRFIFNFPTKDHWKDPSRLDYIRVGLENTVSNAHVLRATSIAIPALGCGLGGLKWEDVSSLIRSAFERLPELRVLLYPPQ